MKDVFFCITGNRLFVMFSDGTHLEVMSASPFVVVAMKHRYRPYAIVRPREKR